MATNLSLTEAASGFGLSVYCGGKLNVKSHTLAERLVAIVHFENES